MDSKGAPFHEYAPANAISKGSRPGGREEGGGFYQPSLVHLDDTKINLHEVLKDHGWLLNANASILTQPGIKRDIRSPSK
ncbi:hypothetical protein CDAR_298961 [Caerostris darwini]|uniref:Uncharacterized protein n=1 Tax=Caerostris darwini TaxID=1538125 RepID=A0AAV4PF47_9ARAC|nr:hypothetical protein CDAR_298961 [Caerostris darwini]